MELKDRPLSWLIRETERAFNLYIKYRDSNGLWFKCISCKQRKTREHMQAGHYWSAGSHGSVRFDERNVHGQCIGCNVNLCGNIAEYKIGLIDKIGIGQYEDLKRKAHKVIKWDREQLITTLNLYRNACKSYRNYKIY